MSYRPPPKDEQPTLHCWQYTLWLLLGLLAILPYKFALAQPTSDPTDDIRVLIDISGSMKRTDPNNLRSPALRLFISLLPTGSTAGVWTFGQWVNMLIKPQQVDDEWKDASRLAAEEINSHGMYTNIEDAIVKSTWDWTRPNPGTHRSLILLTDGIVDISDNPQENAHSRTRIIDDLLPRLRSAGVTINTIALSAESDTDLLHQLAASTGGWSETIDSADSLEKLFLRLFEKASSANTLPLDNNRVTIDGSIKEATFLVFRESNDEETSIEAPGNKAFSEKSHPAEIQWHRESRYDLITIKNPETGDWHINARLDPDNRVMVVTDLRLASTTLPNDLAANQEIVFQVHLEQDGKIIKQKEFLQFVKVSLTQTSMKEEMWSWRLYDDGKMPDIEADDGIFTGHLQDSIIEGEHEIELTVDGTTFKRNSRQLIKVYGQPLSVNISQLNGERIAISIVPYQALIDTKTIRIEAIRTNPSGEVHILDVPSVSSSEWRIEYDQHESPGRHSVTIHVNGSSPSGEPIDATLDPITFNAGAVDDGAHDNQMETTSQVAIPEGPSVEDAAQNVDWLNVGLRMAVLNVFLIMFVITGIKYWPFLRKKIIPIPSDIISNA